MSKDSNHNRSGDPWARLRFSIVGPLLSSPSEHGELEEQIRLLSQKEWIHPVTGKPKRFSFSTIERWYYRARKSRDPVGVLRRKSRSDRGEQPSMTLKMRETLFRQYRRHTHWSMRLHYDNLAVLAETDPELAPMPSYATLVRYMKTHGLTRRKRRGPRDSPGARAAGERLENRETRGFETEHVNALWHLDFHHGSRRILSRSGKWAQPVLLGVLDDCSRLICHAQWYLSETAEVLIHGLCQAFEKRGLPRALMTDNGSAMTACETTQGLHRLSILHEKTLPYSPHQNGKQEVLWAQVEGRLLAMLDPDTPSSLAQLNEATIAWVELEYNRKKHSETGRTPIDLFVNAPDVGRACPSSESLRRAFTTETTRIQRRSDGTITIQGVRFEIPSRYNHIRELRVRYASWDLSEALLVGDPSGDVLCRILPQDKVANADGRRRRRSARAPTPGCVLERREEGAMAPLLRKLVAEYMATGLPPAYLPKSQEEEREE